MLIDIAALEAAIGLAFNDRGLLIQAMVHRSYLHEHPGAALPSNERLEFLGDAALGYIIGEHLYHRYPEMDEGLLTSIRAAVVKASTLARLAAALNLGDYLLMSRGEESGGGRGRAAILSCAYEGLIGAMLIDQGLEATRRFLVAQFAPVVDEVIRDRLDRDDKSILQEVVQGMTNQTPVYRLVGSSGPQHEPQFTVEVRVGEQSLGYGTGRSKREAEQAAAAAALLRVDAVTRSTILKPEAPPE